jgi:hypothetical protein
MQVYRVFAPITQPKSAGAREKYGQKEKPRAEVRGFF